MKKKVLFLMNVDWNWIKQRPHFIAEGLSDSYDVTVVYRYRYRRQGYQKRREKNFSGNVRKLYLIPKLDKFKFLKPINDFIRKYTIRKLLKDEGFECIYVNSPKQEMLIPKWYTGKVIYDCMDDHIALAENKKDRENCYVLEKKLLDKCDELVVTSNTLKKVLMERYPVMNINNITLIRNGYSGEIFDVKKMNTKYKDDKFIFAYFGTISEWFNFDVIIESLKKFKNIEYWIIGPILGKVQFPKDSRIKYLGTVEHDDLYEATKKANCYIMPFKLNDIVVSVDPVKLYEYINFNKNIMTVEYDEIERFRPFVNFYKDTPSYLDAIEKLLTDGKIKYSNEDRIEFLRNNSWQKRVEQVVSVIEK